MLKPITKILCEDIRDEVGNKRSLIGVYGNEITVPKFPASFSIAFYLEFGVVAKGTYLLHFSMEGPGENRAKMNANIVVDEDTPVVLASPRFSAAVNEPGSLVIKMTNEDDTLVLFDMLISLDEED